MKKGIEYSESYFGSGQGTASLENALNLKSSFCADAPPPPPPRCPLGLPRHGDLVLHPLPTDL